MLHNKQIEKNKQDRISETSEAEDSSDDPNADSKTEESLSLESDRTSRGRRSSNSTPKKLSSSQSSSLNNTITATGRQASSSAGRKSVTPPSGKTSKSTNGKGRPHRPGILWKEGGKLEARDFQKKWFSARIVELDDSDNTVLIHFDGWNQRFDEWLKMDSDRLRPATRHSGRQKKKEKPEKVPKTPPKADYKAGEHVFAKWTDCRMYPARIMGVKANGNYDVLFYDGFRKNVQNINMRHMPPEVQDEYSKAGLLAEPKKMKQKMAMFEKLAEKERLANEEREKRKKALAGTSLDEEESGGPSGEKNEKDKEKTPKTEKKPNKDSLTVKKRPGGLTYEPVKTRSHSEEEEKPAVSPQEKEPEISKEETTPAMKRKRSPVTGSFIARKKSKLEKKEKASEAKGIPDTEEDKVQEEGKPQEGKANSAEKKKITKVRSAIRGDIVKPKVKRKRTKGLKNPKTQSQPKALVLEESTPALAEELVSPTSAEPVIPTTPMPEANIPSAPTPSTSDGSVNPDSAAGETPTAVPPKAFLIEDDHNKYKCPFDDCGKGFRKKSLVDYHVKYYHTDDGTPVQAPPPKKRKKTVSQCSEADSEISVGGGRPSSVGKPRKKNRESVGSIPSVPSTPCTPLEVSVSTPPTPVVPTTVISVPKEIGEISIPELVEECQVPDNISEVETKSTTTTTEGYEHHAELLHEESVDTTDEPDSPHDRLAKDEVVNCICQLNEENGLMIQCDVCLCWQHAVCMDITEETLPKKYLCYVCINPPGVRESARYAYDQDWLKQGTMARFGMLPEEISAPQKAQIMKATHELAGDMHNITRVLNALKRKLFALKHRRNPEFRMWSKDWDKEAERQREEQSQAEQHAYENENSLINVDDDFSQIISSELLEHLARTSMEIIAKSGGKLPGADEATNHLVSQAGFSLGQQAELPSTSGFGMEATTDMSQALASHGDGHSSFGVTPGLGLASPGVMDSSLATQGSFSPQIPLSSHSLPAEDKLDQAVNSQLQTDLTVTSQMAGIVIPPSTLIPTVVSSISSDSLENETVTDQSGQLAVTAPKREEFDAPPSTSSASSTSIVSQFNIPQTSVARKDLPDITKDSSSLAGKSGQTLDQGPTTCTTEGSVQSAGSLIASTTSSDQVPVAQPVTSSPMQTCDSLSSHPSLASMGSSDSQPAPNTPLASVPPPPSTSQPTSSLQLTPKTQLTSNLTLTSDIQLNPDLQLNSKPQLVTNPQLMPDNHQSSNALLTSDPQQNTDSQLSSDLKLTSNPPLNTTETPLPSDPQPTSDPQLNTDSQLSSDPKPTSDQTLNTDSHLSSDPKPTSDQTLNTDSQLSSDPKLTPDQTLNTDSQLSCDPKPSSDQTLNTDSQLSSDPKPTSDPLLNTDSQLSSDPKPISDQTLNTDSQLSSDPKPTSDPQLNTDSQLSSDPKPTSGQTLNTYSQLSSDPKPTSDLTLNTDSQLSSDPKPTSDPRLNTDSQLSSGPKPTSDQTLNTDSQLSSGPRLTSESQLTTDSQLVPDPQLTSDPLMPDTCLSSGLGLATHPSLLIEDSSASFSLDSEPRAGIDLQLDTSATESCAETEDPGVLSMDTADPVGDIIGSQDIAHALSNPSMLDDVDPTKLLDDHPDDVQPEEDPKVICEQNLMEHILRHQDNVESRLDLIEKQILALESAEDGGNRTGELMKDLPRVKKIMHQMLTDLLKVKRMALYH